MNCSINMKYSVIALGLLCSTAAVAQPTVTGAFKVEDVVDSANNRTGYELVVSNAFSDRISADVKAEHLATNNTGAIQNRLEVGATPQIPVGPVAVYVRGAVGEKFVPGSNFGYYSAEAGVTVNLINGVSAGVGYRWRDALDANIADQTSTIRGKITYALTENVSIGGTYDHARGDSNYNGYNVSVGVRF